MESHWQTAEFSAEQECMTSILPEPIYCWKWSFFSKNDCSLCFSFILSVDCFFFYKYKQKCEQVIKSIKSKLLAVTRIFCIHCICVFMNITKNTRQAFTPATMISCPFSLCCMTKNYWMWTEMGLYSLGLYLLEVKVLKWLANSQIALRQPEDVFLTNVWCLAKTVYPSISHMNIICISEALDIGFAELKRNF